MRAPRIRIVLVILAALAAAIFGATRLFAAFSAPAQASQVANLDGLTASVTAAKWSTMDHDMSANAPGYQMPPAMMPGMPEQGKDRLAVSVTVTNTTAETRPLRVGQEFVLRVGADGARVTPHSDTFGQLPRLAAHNAVSGRLFFDLPRADLVDSSAWIEWTHGGATTRMTVPLNGAETGSNHPHKP